ncbi:MAG TPA: ABC transporter permease, partial [bacterium]
MHSPAATTLASAPVRERSKWVEAVAVFLRTQPLGAIGAAVVAFLVLVAVFAPWIAPYGAKVTEFEAFLTPDETHWFGTDHLGRDVFSRVV